MVSTIDALVSRNDVIVYDVDSHACIVDGVRLHAGKRLLTDIMISKVLKKLNQSSKVLKKQAEEF
jgi:glycine C-acetyltransferase